MAQKKTVFIRGKAQYPKIFKAVPNYNKDGFEWTIDLALDPAGVAQATAEISKKKLKDSDSFGTYIRFKQGTTYKDAETGEVKNRNPPEVVDANGNAWDPEVKIGNGSLVDVKAQVVDYGAGKELGVYLQKVRVLDHVAYEDDFPELTGEDVAFKTAAKAEGSPIKNLPETVGDIMEDLDDEVPM